MHGWQLAEDGIYGTPFEAEFTQVPTRKECAFGAQQLDCGGAF
jgi:hypothetical protein